MINYTLTPQNEASKEALTNISYERQRSEDDGPLRVWMVGLELN